MNKPQIIREQGLINTGRIDSPRKQNNATKITREELAKNLKKMRERDNELVTGMFKNYENPTRGSSRGALSFCIKLHKDDEVATYELIDGERYTIPRGVARHLNNNCYVKVYEPLPGNADFQTGSLATRDGRVKQQAQMAKKQHRFGFVSMEYMDDDIDMYPSNLVEVTFSP